MPTTVKQMIAEVVCTFFYKSDAFLLVQCLSVVVSFIFSTVSSAVIQLLLIIHMLIKHR